MLRGEVLIYVQNEKAKTSIQLNLVIHQDLGAMLFLWAANLTQTDADLLHKPLLDDAELIVSLRLYP